MQRSSSFGLERRSEMHVLLLTQYYWPETFPITAEVARLRAEGAKVTVLTGKPNYPDGQVFDGYKAWGVQREWHDGVEIFRVPLVPRGQNSGVRLALNYISFVLSAGLLAPLLLRRQRFNTVFVYAPSPILQALPGILIARLKQAKLVLWVQDLWPESLSATGAVTDRRILAVVASVVRYIYRHSDRILVQSRAFRQPVSALANDRSKVHYLPNPTPDLTPPDQVAQDVALLADDIGSGFSIVFAGNLGRAQALDVVMDAARELEDLASLRIFLIGSGSMDTWLHEQIARYQLTNVVLPGRFPADAMPPLLSKAATLLVSLRGDEIFTYTVPSKLQTYLAIGRPIVAVLDGEGAAILTEAGAGFISPTEDPTALASTIRKMYETSEKERADMGAAGRAYFEAEFAPELITKALMQHLLDEPVAQRATTEI